MKLVIQRVQQSKVEVEGKTVGSIGPGALVLLGITHNDTEIEASWLVNKLLNLRFFEDENGKINRSLLDCKREVLLISQFTLYADCNDGRRPSFIEAANPEKANHLYEFFAQEIRKSGLKIATGQFGANMQVSLTNDGPVTLVLERIALAKNGSESF